LSQKYELKIGRKKIIVPLRLQLPEVTLGGYYAKKFDGKLKKYNMYISYTNVKIGGKDVKKQLFDTFRAWDHVILAALKKYAPKIKMLKMWKKEYEGKIEKTFYKKSWTKKCNIVDKDKDWEVTGYRAPKLILDVNVNSKTKQTIPKIYKINEDTGEPEQVPPSDLMEGKDLRLKIGISSDMITISIYGIFVSKKVETAKVVGGTSAMGIIDDPTDDENISLDE